jgi:hypothetical protein
VNNDLFSFESLRLCVRLKNEKLKMKKLVSLLTDEKLKMKNEKLKSSVSSQQSTC